jgi:hypothetical protein
MQRTQLFGALFASTLLALAPQAQGGTCDFQIIQAESNFSFSGTTSLGAIVGTPPNFQLSGNLLIDLAAEGSPISTGKLVSGDALVVGGLHAEVPNPFPFFPPLASIDVTNLHLSPASNPFNGVGNTFGTDVTVTTISGSADVVPLVGDPSTLDLTGAVSEPTASAGSITQIGSVVRVTVPVNLTLDFEDVASGVTGTINLVGSLVASHDLADGCNTSLFTTDAPISLGLGGGSTFLLDSGVSNANEFYWIFGSVTGTSPGIALGSVTLPLNFDAFFNLTLTRPGAGVFTNLLGFLDASGQQVAGFGIPAGLDPALAGLVINFAYAAGPVIGTTDFASNPITVVLGS